MLLLYLKGKNIISWCFIALLVWCAAVWDLATQLAAKQIVGPRSRKPWDETVITHIAADR